jgi:chromate transport protein ChrA
VQPPPEHVHWLFATGFLTLGICQLAEAVVGEPVWRRRAWRAYLWPGTAFVMGLWMWPVMVFYTSSTIHMLAHGAWAHVMMVAGAAQLGLARGKLQNRRWELTMALAFFVSGLAFLFHEQNGWLFSRSAFLHHVLGWTLIAGSVFPLARSYRPGSAGLRVGYAATMVAVAVLLYSHRDVAAIFGHLSELAEGSS